MRLTTKEFSLFQALYNADGQPVSRDKLLETLSEDEKITARNIDVHVYSLRKKIKPSDLIIVTVWGEGYRLTEL